MMKKHIYGFKDTRPDIETRHDTDTYSTLTRTFVTHKAVIRGVERRRRRMLSWNFNVALMDDISKRASKLSKGITIVHKHLKVMKEFLYVE